MEAECEWAIRLFDEQEELGNRIVKLKKYLRDVEMEQDIRELLEFQLEAMVTYIQCISSRIDYYLENDNKCIVKCLPSSQSYKQKSK